MRYSGKRKRKNSQIPEGEPIHDYLFVQNAKSSKAKYQLLNELLKRPNESLEQQTIEDIGAFFGMLSARYPETAKKWQLLNVLILKQIIGIEAGDDDKPHRCKKKKLDEEFYKDLRGL